MKKRVLSVLLVIALLVAVGIVAAQANESDPTPAQIKAEADAVIERANALTIDPANPVAVCPLCGGEAKTWKPLATEIAIGRNLSVDHYFLDGENVAYKAIHNNSSGTGRACVFMNPGSSLTTYGAAAFSGAMNLMGNGTVTVATNPADDEAGTAAVVPGNILSPGGYALGMSIYGGTYSAAEGTAITNGGIWGHSGVLKLLNIYGGTFKDVKVNETTSYPAISIYNGAVANIYGGNIDTFRLNAFGNAGTGCCNIYGGNVTNFLANDGLLTVEGGNIGTITTGTSMDTVTISGNPVIGTLPVNTIKPTFGALTEGASIGLGSYTGVISTAYESKEAAQAVADTFPTIPGKEIVVNEDKTLSAVARTTPYTPEEIVAESAKQTFGTTETEAFCYHCGEYVTWKPLTGSASVWNTGGITQNQKLTEGKHFFIANDIAEENANAILLFSTWSTSPAYTGTWCIHLNNKTLQNTDPANAAPVLRVWSANCNVNLMGRGTLISNGGWGTVFVKNSTVNIYGGEFSNTSSNGYAVSSVDLGTVNLYGGSAGTQTVSVRKHNDEAPAPVLNVDSDGYKKVAVTIANATVNLNDCDLTSVTLSAAATLNVKGGEVDTLTVTAGTVGVSGGTVNTLTATAGNVVLSGKPTVGLNTDLDVDATGLTGGQISGMKEGVFTTAFDSKPLAEAVIPYFTVEEGKAVTVTDDLKLTYGGRVYTPEEIVTLSAQQTFGTEETEAFCYACGKTVTWKPLNGSATIWENANVTNNKKFTEGKHFFISQDIEETQADGMFVFSTWSSAEAYCGTWCIHVNGKTVENKGTGFGVFRLFTGTTAVNVMGDGVLISNALNYGAFHAENGGLPTGATANINSYFSGELHGKGGNSFAVTTAGSAVVNIYGGDIKNKLNPSGTGGTNVYGANIASIANDDIDKAASFYLTTDNCTIDTLTMPGAGNVTVKGGSINTVKVGINGGAPKLVGDITVNAISLEEGKVLDLTGMTGGSLNVGAHEGVFTTNFENESKAEAAAAFITSPTKIVAVDGLALTTADGAVAVVNGESQKAYATYADAETAYTEGYIKLFGNDAINITKNVTIDFNGQSVDVTGSGELTGFDSTTKGKFSARPGEMEIPNTITILVPEPETEETLTKGYLAVTDDYGITTFSYYEMKLSGVSLKAKEETVGMYYKGTWSFNDYLPEGKVQAGVVVNAYDQAVDNPFENGVTANPANGYYSTAAENIANGTPVTSVLVKDIMMAEGLTPEKNSQNGQTRIKAAAFITVNGKDIVTGIKNLSVKDILDMFELEENVNKYNAMETQLGKFYQTWVDRADLGSWNLKKIPHIEIAA